MRKQHVEAHLYFVIHYNLHFNVILLLYYTKCLPQTHHTIRLFLKALADWLFGLLSFWLILADRLKRQFWAAIFSGPKKVVNPSCLV